MHVQLISLNGKNFDFLISRLGFLGFSCKSAGTVADWRDFCEDLSCAAIVVHAARCNGELTRSVATLREHGVELPLLTMSESSDWQDRVSILDAGSDDHLDFPVRSDELAARLRAVMRRQAGHASSHSLIGDFALDLKARSVALDGQRLDLTRNEYQVLQALLTKGEQYVSLDRLAACLNPGDHGERSINAVQVHICRLRSKIGQERIQTVRGMGYRINPFRIDLSESFDGAADDFADEPRRSMPA